MKKGEGVDIKISGNLDQMQRQLRELSKRVGGLGGQHEVSIKDLFNTTFLHRHTSFFSIDNMFAKSGFKIETQEDFNAIPDAQWDTFIRLHTKFASWKDMMSAAATEWIESQLK